jgi:hypothetical protein
MATTVRTVDDLARMFAERLPAHGGYISAKQARWLKDVYRRERGRGYDPREQVGGDLCEDCHAGWSLQEARNGAGMLRLGVCIHRPCTEAACSCQDGGRYTGAHLNAPAEQAEDAAKAAWLAKYGAIE